MHILSTSSSTFRTAERFCPKRFFYIGCDCRRHGHGHGGDDRDSGAEGVGAHGDDGSGTDKDGDCSGNSSGGSDRDAEDEDCNGNSNSSGGSDTGEDGDCSGNSNSSGGSDRDDESEDCSGNSNSSGGSDRDEDEDCTSNSNSSDGSGTDKDGDCSGNSNGNSSGGSDRDEDEDDSGSSDGSSSYGGDVDNGDDGGGDDSACSGNYGLHFLDLLAKSMPVPDDTDTKISFIPSSAHVGSSSIHLLCSCNGLLLFGCAEGSESYHSQGYIVCNPATKQWKTVPSRGWVRPNSKVRKQQCERTFLFFDPAVPSRFLFLIQFWHVHRSGGKGVHTYSSETGKWSNRSEEWKQFASGGQWGDEFGVKLNPGLGSSFLNGMLHFCLEGTEDVLVVAVDGEGCICRIMHWPPDMFSEPVFIGQSQGRLHCISADIVHQGKDQRDRIKMHVDVLQDYDAEEWQIERKINIWGGDLSGGEEYRGEDYRVVGFHPDGNSIYFVDRRKGGGLIQYHRGGEVLRLCTHIHSFGAVIPYVPCFSRSPGFDI